MSRDLIKNFRTLPEDVIGLIVSYGNVIVFRNGKFINRLNRDDVRYTVLSFIPKPIYISRNRIILHLTKIDDIDYNYESGYILKYILDDRVRMKISFFHRHSNKYGSYYYVTSELSYIFDKNNRWSRLVEYKM